MRGTEIRAAGELADEALAGVAGIVRDVQRACPAGRSGRSGRPPRRCGSRTTRSPAPSTPPCASGCAPCRAAAVARSRLAAALEALVAEGPVEEIGLVGHSMGGLVARSACHYGERDGLAWTGRRRHVVCLGSPHMGAPLERACDVGATIARDEDSAFGRLIGDVLVQLPSASGEGPLRKLASEIDHGMHLGGAHHLQLLDRPRVYERMLRWLTGSPAAGDRPALPARAGR